MNKIGLTSNKLKIIAIITMIIDHIGYYFQYLMSDNVYLTLRLIGRISMPIFVFLLVQGYCKTSNVKKYILRLFKYAIITQLAILSVYFINYNLVPSYYTVVHEQFNILFSFCLSLTLIYMLDVRREIFKSIIIDIIFKMFVVTLIILIYLNYNIDYKFIVPLMVLLMYINEIINNKGSKINKYIYNFVLILIVCICGILQGEIGKFSIFSVIVILLYNGQLGKKNIMLKRLFYFIFPLQHFLLYLSSILLFYYRK